MMSRIMRIVVVLPAPLGPRKPSSSPGRTSNERSRTTSVLPKRFQAPSTTTAGEVVITLLGYRERAPRVA